MKQGDYTLEGRQIKRSGDPDCRLMEPCLHAAVPHEEVSPAEHLLDVLEVEGKLVLPGGLVGVAGAGVVGGESVNEVAVVNVQIAAQNAAATLDIGFRIGQVRAALHVLTGTRHDLHEARRSNPRTDLWIETGFDLDDSQNQFNFELVFFGVFLNQRSKLHAGRLPLLVHLGRVGLSRTL